MTFAGNNAHLGEPAELQGADRVLCMITAGEDLEYLRGPSSNRRVLTIPKAIWIRSLEAW
jgi:hypothetical protein